ncbi:hypothetical protein ARMSODRAFT_1035759 [Armillaria solidipes]|uniref:Uncharacterized protein n=1 Tax=Armillaria solidipes TaxID=1076256 RepID=A0A2H3BGL5_9AGAR|nr:hypothetical protein ARMSODRAFT_1035759 [Armillaria solidipes]
MASFLLDQQLTSIVALLALSSVVVILRIIILHFLSRQQHNPSDVVTRGTDQDTEYEGCIACLRSVRIVRAPPALPQPITTPPPRPSWFIFDITNHITQIFYVIVHFNPFTTPFCIPSTGDTNTQSDNHTRRGVYSADGITHHGLGDRNLNIVINTPVHTSNVDSGGTQGGEGENTEGS